MVINRCRQGLFGINSPVMGDKITFDVEGAYTLVGLTEDVVPLQLTSAIQAINPSRVRCSKLPLTKDRWRGFVGVRAPSLLFWNFCSTRTKLRSGQDDLARRREKAAGEARGANRSTFQPVNGDLRS